VSSVCGLVVEQRLRRHFYVHSGTSSSISSSISNDSSSIRGFQVAFQTIASPASPSYGVLFVCTFLAFGSYVFRIEYGHLGRFIDVYMFYIFGESSKLAAA
jgi:hypothetical protein